MIKVRIKNDRNIKIKYQASWETNKHQLMLTRKREKNFPSQEVNKNIICRKDIGGIAKKVGKN